METKQVLGTQTLAHTTAALLRSSSPFMVLGMMATLLSAIALLMTTNSLPIKASFLMVLLLALPLAWFSLRIIFDAKIMQHWADTAQQDEKLINLTQFDQSLLALGLQKTPTERDLATRARGCVKLQKWLLALAGVQWGLFMFAIIWRC